MARGRKGRGREEERESERERESIHPSHCMSAVHCFNVSHSPSVKVDSATMGGVRTADSGHCPAMAD